MSQISFIPFYTLVRHVEYEGGDFLGNFSSLEAVFAYLDQLDGFLMEDWHPEASDLEVLDSHDTDKHGVTSGWDLTGPAGVSFHIYACSVGAA